MRNTIRSFSGRVLKIVLSPQFFSLKAYNDIFVKLQASYLVIYNQYKSDPAVSCILLKSAPFDVLIGGT